jgi:glutamyl-tRNA synthetase
MIVNQHGKPYSKRDGAAFVGEFKESGFLPEALLNFLTLLGWSPGGDREKLRRAELVELFSLDRVKSSPAQMDLRKLTHLNSQYVAELPLVQFTDAAKSTLVGSEWAQGVDEDYFGKVCALMQSRTHLYSYARDWKYFFSDEFDYEEKAVRKALSKEGVKEGLCILKDRLVGVEWRLEPIEKAIRETESECGIREGKLNQAVRVAVTGRSAGAGLYETMELLGRERVLKRLESAGEMMNGE